MVEQLSGAAHLDALERFPAEFIYREVRSLSHTASAVYHRPDPESAVLSVSDHCLHVGVAVMPYACGVCDHIISAEQLQLLVLYIIAVRVRDAAVVITRFTYRFRHRERAAYRLVADTVNVDV